MKYDGDPEQDKMFEGLREKMITALCSEQEIEATFNLTPLEENPCDSRGR